VIAVQPLTAAAFAPFGTVVEMPKTGGRPANDGTALRFDDLAPLVLNAPGGRPLLSWMRVTPVTLPFACRQMERHPRSSQMFMPLAGRAFLVVVAPRLGEAPDPAGLVAFLSSGAQGVNFAPGTWHHAALAVEAETAFLVLSHAASEPDCDIHVFPDGGILVG